MADFKIKRGLSTTLFPTPGVVNPRLIIELGCWYLCTDTAELYMGVSSTDDELTLKRINGENLDSALAEVKNELSELKNTVLFKKITSEVELPSDFSAVDFNPNITYYIPLKNSDGTISNKVSTYIFDEISQSYMCTNCMDDSVILNMVVEAIDSTLDSRLAVKLPIAIKETLESTILFGGKSL